MKNGLYDLNTTDRGQISLSRRSLEELTRLVNVRIDNNDYTEVPTGDTWIHHAWSGDMAAAPSYMPKGVPVDVVGYWFPSDGKGPVANDTNVVLRSATNPVLAHKFLDFMLDEKNAYSNFVDFNGYTPPQKAIDAESLIKSGLIPESLRHAVVRPDQFAANQELLQLSVEGERLYDQAWSKFKAG